MQAPVPPPPHVHATPQTSGLAIASLICGCMGFITGFVTGIPAVITGHMAKGAIKRSGGALTGSGMATSGLVLGYLTTFFTLFIAVAALATPIIFKSLERANMSHNATNAKILTVGMEMYAMDNDGKYPPDLRVLETQGYIPSYDRLRYTESKGKVKHDWIYLDGYSNTDPPSTILIAAPIPTTDGKRVVSFLDGSARPMREAQFQSEIRTQEGPGFSSGP